LKNIGKFGCKNPQVKLLSAADYGVPQIRKRLVVMAALGREIDFPPPTRGGQNDRPHSTAGWPWPGGLAPLALGEVDPGGPDQRAMRLSPLNLAGIRATPEGGGRSGWPERPKPGCRVGHAGRADVCGRLSFARPSPALTTKCVSRSDGRRGRPVGDRAPSVREAACLQTFPRSFQFSGFLMSGARRAGNAAPPLLAGAVGKSFVTSDRKIGRDNRRLAIKTA
jgi:DNA (cytosine-5)-methyltransferase 1